MNEANEQLKVFLEQDEESIVQRLLTANYSAEDLSQLQQLEWQSQNRSRVLAAIVQLKRDIG